MSTDSLQPKLIIHGGAGLSLKTEGKTVVRTALSTIVKQVYDGLLEGSSAVEAVIRGCQLLEDEPIFNAGTGSVLQSDGQIRMSASLMDGEKQSLSGVINVSRVKNPIYLAKELQNQVDRILSEYGAAELARELGIPPYDPLTDARLYEWIEERKGNFSAKMAGIVAEERRGTIGVVALDKEGRIAAGTSTGGKGLEKIGRVSDSPTPAGTYANAMAGVSCTGIGEDILDECLAAKIVIRVTDGLSLREAMEKSIKECQSRKRDLAAISLDNKGNIVWGKTCETIVAAYHNGQAIADSLDVTADWFCY